MILDFTLTIALYLLYQVSNDFYLARCNGQFSFSSYTTNPSVEIALPDHPAFREYISPWLPGPCCPQVSSLSWHPSLLPHLQIQVFQFFDFYFSLLSLSRLFHPPHVSQCHFYSDNCFYNFMTPIFISVASTSALKTKLLNSIA